MKKILLVVFFVIALAVIYLFVSGNNHIFKAVASTYLVGESGPTIDDYTKFENRTVPVGKAQPWPLSNKYNEFHPNANQIELMKDYQSVAFLIIHKDSILYEKYWNGYSEESLTNSFSVAKSLVGLAIGVAIKEKKIKGLSQKAGDFLPKFVLGKKSKVSIKDLLTMSSGIDFGESYNDPFGFMSKTYYGDDLYELSVGKPMEYPPGKVWEYQGGNTLLLSFILEKATGMTVSEYFSEKIWKPIGAGKAALWSLNKENGREKAFCCFYSNARDFAKIGKLYLQNGRWEGDTLIPYWYVRESISPVNITDEENDVVDYYGYHWWLTEYKGQEIYYARGIQGQYITVIPEEELIIVRLGKERDSAHIASVPKDLLAYIEIGKSLATQNTIQSY